MTRHTTSFAHASGVMDSTLRCAASDAALRPLHRRAPVPGGSFQPRASPGRTPRRTRRGTIREVVVHLLRLVVERVGEVEQRELEELGVRGVRDEGRDRVGGAPEAAIVRVADLAARATQTARWRRARRTRTIGRPRRARDPPCTRARRGCAQSPCGRRAAAGTLRVVRAVEAPQCCQLDRWTPRGPRSGWVQRPLPFPTWRAASPS